MSFDFIKTGDRKGEKQTMKKTKMTTKAFSMFLSVIMLFTMVSVGIIVPDAKVEAATVGETHPVTTIVQINNAIAAANTAGPDVITTIKLDANINYSGSLASFTELKTANVVFDFNGYALLMTYTLTEGRGSSGSSAVQLPNANAGNTNNNNVDTFTNGMFIIREGSTMQIINTKPNNICTMQVYADFEDNSRGNYTAFGDGELHNYSSASLIYNEGTLIIGDKDNSSYNDFTLYAHSSTRNTNADNPNMYYKKSATTNVYTVTVNSSSAILKMYGGKVEATGVSRARRGLWADVICYALNVNNCYTAEIYGGEINIPKSPVDNNNGISQCTGNASNGATARISAIRCNTPYLYIFDVDCAVQTQTGADSSKDEDLYTSCIYTTADANAPYVYGANLSYSAYRAGGNSTAENRGYVVRGAYKLASNGTLNPSSVSGSNYGETNPGAGNTGSGSVATYTVFIGDDGTAENGIDMFSYNTYRQYLAQYGTALDVYFGNTIMTTNGASTQEVGSTNYLRNGYTHKNWQGKTHPGSAYNETYKTPGAAGVTSGGSLFLAPLWEENVYTITYDWNDSVGATKVSDTSSCPATYKITSTSTLGTPVRHGYKFTGWAVTKYEYPTTDTKKPWSLAVYPAGFSLNGRNGNIWLQAQWEELSYTATFDLNGGNIDGNTADIVKDYTVNKVFQFPQGIQKDYYTFNGNFKVTTADGSWPANNTLYAAGDVSTLGSYGNPVFTAQFTPIQYTVTYDSNNGSSVDDESVKTYNVESKHVLPAVTRTGFHFVGWVPVSSSGSWSGAKTYPAGTSFEGMNGDVTLKAKWESATYDLTLDLDETESIVGGTQFNYAYANSLEINNPTKTGYEFTGWRVSAAPDAGTTWVVGETFTDGIADGKVTIPANKLGSVTLEPMWKTVSYTVSFNANGGSGVTPWTFTIEDSFSLPTTTKMGYTFAGWSVSENGGNWNDENYAAGQTVSGMYGNATLIANWERTNYVVTLDADGGTVSPAVLSYNFETIVALPVPAKTGFSFTGWKVTTVEPSASWELDTVYTDALPAGQYGNVTLTAQWEHTAYNIHFVSTGTTPSDFKYYIDSETFNVPASSYPGFRFLYWNVTTPAGNWEMNEKVYTDTDITGKYGNVTLNANFEAIPYTIIYKDIDGTTETVNYDMSTPVTLKTYERAGYAFSGWRVESVTDGSGWAGTYQPGEYTAGERYGNVVLIPVLTAAEYEITFIPDGGTPYANLTYTIESTDTLPTPEKTGYDFAGWKVTLAAGNWADGETVNGGTAVTDKYGDVTLTAQWTPKKYTITWVTDNGTYTTDGSYGLMPDYSSVDTSKPADAQYTYTFTGWSPALQTVTGEATYTAQYSKTVNSYTVTWIYETDETSGAKTETATYKYGEHPIFNGGANPEKTSESGKYYRFIGWMDQNGNYLTTDTVVTGAVTYTAEFKEVEAPRTVTWIINGVSYPTKWGVGETPAYAGTPIKPDSNGIKYTFSGWTPAISVVEAGKDYEYEAVFTESDQTYTASFDLDGGSYSGNTEVTYNKTAGLNMPQPTKTGYDFAGWRVVANSGTWTQADLLTFTTYTGLWGDVSFKAEYTPKEYTIKAEADDGTTPEYKYTIESTDTLPVLTKDGFVLSGWMIVSAEGNWIAGDTVAADKILTGMYGDVTIHPIWTARLYKINWVSGDVTQTVEFKFGDPVITYPPIAKAGYTAAWDKTVPAVMPAEDLTFTAVYTPIQYYLRFNTAGGSAVENFYYDITSEGVLPTPTREGATFKGWKVSAGSGSWVKNKVYEGGTSLTGMYGNITLTAVWEIELHTVTWVAGDVTKVTKWYHGATPSFDGTPYKSSDEYNSYIFTGWDKEIVSVTEDVTYTAIFEATERLYTIRWNVDGHIVEEKQYKYGETPAFGGETPTRPSTTEFDFTFAGWSPEISTVTGDVTYVALFDVFTKLQGLRVDKSAVFLKIGEEAVVSAILSPATATNKDVEWISSDESIATVNAMGKITAVGSGDTVIRVQSKDGKFKSYCVVSVAPVITEYLVVSAGYVSTTRLPGEAIQLTARVMPENATNKNVTWSSSNTAIAKVDQNGLVIFGDVPGTAVISAVADGYATGSIEVTTASDSAEIDDSVKTYVVMFMESTAQYIIAGNSYEAITIVCAEGDTIEFLLSEPHFVTANGVQFPRDTDGVFRISNIDQNYAIVSTERADIGFEDDNGNEPAQKLSFFDRLKAFFRSIVEFFRNLFS